MLDKIRAAIFDMDGTLIDSMGMWRGVIPAFLSARGLTLSPDVKIELSGQSFRRCAEILTERLCLRETVDEIMELWDRHVKKAYESVHMKPGVPELLCCLKSRGIRMCVATLTDRENAKRVLKRLGILGCFEFILTAQEAGAGKDKPDIFLLSARMLGQKPESCLVLEDSFVAAVTARSAGFVTCGVFDRWCRQQPSEFMAAVDFYVDDFDALFKTLAP